MTTLTSKLKQKLKRIRLLLLDVDGVLTDGSIIYDDDGGEIKNFNVKDGMGIRLLGLLGIDVGIITGRRSNALLHRCKNLGIELVYDGIRDKAEILKQLSKKQNLQFDEIAFVGDDLPDLSIMAVVGLSVAVADAHPVVRESADLITEANGGDGAVRELCEVIIHAQGRWEKVMEHFLP
ncbi:MAG: HAD-IIIA family hydrolase [Deltaproteobacteria bacterium]|nr:HAD-IIIA family hydrolase [Deltaproteobacteria bacterium]